MVYSWSNNRAFWDETTQHDPYQLVGIVPCWPKAAFEKTTPFFFFFFSNFAQFIWKSILFCCRLGFFSNHIQWSKSKNKLKLIQCKSLITHFSTSIVSAFATYVRGIYPSSPVTKDFANHHSPVLWKKICCYVSFVC